MAPRTTNWIDATDLLGPGWQCTPIARTERGEWTLTVRLGARGIEESFHGRDGAAVLAKAGRHAQEVARLLSRHQARQQCARPALARAAQEFDLAALPLFGDQARQLDMIDALS